MLFDINYMTQRTSTVVVCPQHGPASPLLIERGHDIMSMSVILVWLER